MASQDVNLAGPWKPGGASARGSIVFRRLWHLTYRQARRLVIAVVGTSVLLIGVALLFLPGPAIVVIPAGLAILSIEFAWARNFLNRVRREISERSRQARMGRRD